MRLKPDAQIAQASSSAVRRRIAAKSAARAFDILDYFGAESRPLRAGEIAQTFKFSPSTTDQLLKTLVHRGYLTFSQSTKLYFPSVRLLTFANMLSTHYGGPNLQRLLSNLQSETGEVVTVVTVCDACVQIVECPVLPEFKGLSYAIDTVPGRVLLSQHSERAARRIVERAVLHRSCSAERAGPLIDSSLAIRKAGYSSGRSGVLPNWWVVTVPLPCSAAGVPTAIAVSGKGRQLRSNELDLVHLVQNSIQRILH
jgi:DNA-binding IclR family transcriptional regulator